MKEEVTFMLKIAGAVSKGLRQLVSNSVARFTDETLRGVGQVMLQNHPVTGLLLGIFVNGWVFGLYALLGDSMGQWSRREPDCCSEHRTITFVGANGFNGTLTRLGLSSYLRHDTTLWSTSLWPQSSSPS
jgi:urea transporter